MKQCFLILLLIILVFNSNAQTVGVVLSGGGARVLAHIGVLKSIEENNIYEACFDDFFNFLSVVVKKTI